MRILVVYATTEGQTGKIASFGSERLSRQGHRVTNVSACRVACSSIQGGSMPF